MLLEAIRPVFAHAGPFITIEADVGRPDEHGLDKVDARWTTLRHQLEDLKVPLGLIDDVHRDMTSLPPLPGDVRRTMVLADGDVVFDDMRLGAGTEAVAVEIAPLPNFTPWITSRDTEIPFVLVQADRAGADVNMFRAHGYTPSEGQSVSGETFQITKVPEGDWAQKQYQRRAERLWGRTAAEVAGAVTNMARRTHPATVLVAGDERAADLIEQQWNPRLGPLIKLDAGGRAAGTSAESLDDEIAVALAELAAHAEEDLAERLAEGMAHGWAAVGLADVLDAFIEGRVDVLAIDPSRAAAVTVRPADHPGLSLPAEAMSTGELAADRVLTALAARTGAVVRVIDESLLPRDGMSAVLRWSESS